MSLQHAAEIASVHAAKNVNDRRDVVMREHRRLHGARDGGDVGENLLVALRPAALALTGDELSVSTANPSRIPARGR